jgi:uncharacterized protein (DUF2141 family)
MALESGSTLQQTDEVAAVAPGSSGGSGGGGASTWDDLSDKPSVLTPPGFSAGNYPSAEQLASADIASALSHDPGLDGGIQTTVRASDAATDDALVTEQAAREAINNAGSNISDLADLSDVSSAKQADGHVLASGGGSYREEDVSTLASDHVPVGALKGVGTSGLSDGQVLSYTGASWANESVSSLLSGHASLADIGNVLADASTGTPGNALLLADPDADATLEWVARSVSEQIRQDGELSIGDVSIAGSNNVVKQDTEPDPTNFQAGDIWVDTDATPVPEAYVARDTDGDGALEWNATSTAIAGGNIVTNSIAAEQIQAGSITANEIDAETITANEIATGTLTADEIDAGTITANEIDADTITSRELKSRSIEGTILKANTISATVIMSDVITAEQLSANTITSLEIATDTLTAEEIGTGTLTATEISSDTITANELAAGTITSQEISADTITSQEISADTITSSEISADTITSSEVATNTLTAGEIAADTITSAEVATGTLTSSEIAASTITTTELAADSISTSELQSDAATIGNVVIQGNNSVRQSTTPSAPASGQQKIWVDTSTSPPTAKKYDHVNDVWAAISSTFIDGEVIQSSSVRGREIASDTVEADNVAARTLTSSEISANTISASEIATSTITASEVATDTLTATQISSGTITASEISTGTITATEISADTITTTELAADVITASEISADAVTTSELSADSVTGAQIDATSTITVGTGTPIKLDGSGDEIRSGNFDLADETGFRLAGPNGTRSFIHNLKTTALTASGGASFGSAVSAPTGEIDSVKTDAIKPQSGSSVVDVHGALRSDDYASGFAGSGFALEDDGSAEVSSLSVRETLTARSLEKQQLRYTRGANITSVGGGKVDSVTDNGSGNYILTFATDHGLASGDLLLSQEQDPSGGTEADLSGAVTSQVRAEVTSVVDAQTADVSVDTAYATPSEGDDFVVVGSTSDTTRDSVLLADPYGPFHDVLDGISSWSDWDNRVPKTRLGYLNGAPDLSSGDSPSGYGLYAGNAYIEGAISADAGEIGALSINGNTISNKNGTTAVEINADGSGYLGAGSIAWDADGTVTANTVAANSIGTNELKAGSVTANEADFQDLSSVAAEIAGFSLSSNTIASNGVSLNANNRQLAFTSKQNAGNRLVLSNADLTNFARETNTAALEAAEYDGLGREWVNAYMYDNPQSRREMRSDIGYACHAFQFEIGTNAADDKLVNNPRGNELLEAIDEGSTLKLSFTGQDGGTVSVTGVDKGQTVWVAAGQAVDLQYIEVWDSNLKKIHSSTAVTGRFEFNNWGIDINFDEYGFFSGSGYTIQEWRVGDGRFTPGNNKWEYGDSNVRQKARKKFENLFGANVMPFPVCRGDQDVKRGLVSAIHKNDDHPSVQNARTDAANASTGSRFNFQFDLNYSNATKTDDPDGTTEARVFTGSEYAAIENPTVGNEFFVKDKVLFKTTKPSQYVSAYTATDKVQQIKLYINSNGVLVREVYSSSDSLIDSYNTGMTVTDGKWHSAQYGLDTFGSGNATIRLRKFEKNGAGAVGGAYVQTQYIEKFTDVSASNSDSAQRIAGGHFTSTGSFSSAIADFEGDIYNMGYGIDGRNNRQVLHNNIDGYKKGGFFKMTWYQSPYDEKFIDGAMGHVHLREVNVSGGVNLEINKMQGSNGYLYIAVLDESKNILKEKTKEITSDSLGITFNASTAGYIAFVPAVKSDSSAFQTFSSLSRFNTKRDGYTFETNVYRGAMAYNGIRFLDSSTNKAIEISADNGEGLSQNGWTTFSDERDKIIEGRLGARGGELDALEKAKSIKGLRFKREEDGPEMVGVSAQQVEKVLPEAVSKRVWNRESGETRKAVNYGMLHGIHLEAIETLAIGAETRDQKIRRLQHRVDELESQLQNS